MARKKKHPEHVNHERWLVSYADFITLLFAFFVVMFASSQVDTKKMGEFSESFSRAVGESFLMDGGRQLLPDGTPPHPEETSAGSGEGKLPKELRELARKLGDNHEELAGLKILQRRNELVIRLSDSLLFDSGEDTLKEPAKRVVLSIADELRARKVDIRVEGHTDNVPIHTLRFRSNWDLSTARATAVIEELYGPGRIAATRLAASGYGEFRPVAANITPEGRAQNRRVDLVIAAALDLPMEEAKPIASGSPSAEPSAGPSAEPTLTVYGPPPPPDPSAEPAAEPAKEGAPEHGAAPSEHGAAAPSEHGATAPSEHGAAPSEHGAAPSEHGAAAPSEHDAAPSAKPLEGASPEKEPAKEATKEPRGEPAKEPRGEPAKDRSKEAAKERAKEPPPAAKAAPSASAKVPATKRKDPSNDAPPPPSPADLWMLRH